MAELLRETRELDGRSASDLFDYHHWFESIHRVEIEARHRTSASTPRDARSSIASLWRPSHG